MYEINPDRVIYETDIYAVDVGQYPGEPIDSYRIWNKRYNVLEYGHSMYFFAIQWCNEATRTYKKVEQGIDEEEIEEGLPELGI